MLKELSKPLNSSQTSTKYQSSYYRTPAKKNYESFLMKKFGKTFSAEKLSNISKDYSSTNNIDSPFKTPEKLSFASPLKSSDPKSNFYSSISTYNNLFNGYASPKRENSNFTSDNKMLRSCSLVPSNYELCQANSEKQYKKKKKKILVENISTLSKRLSHCNTMINVYQKCNAKTAEENLKIEFEQDNVVHERIHISGIIPRLRLQINDMRYQIMKLERETKGYEILKYQYIQEKLFMEDDLKKTEAKVKDLALETNKLSYGLQRFKNKIKEIKIILAQRKQKNTFVTDIVKLIETEGNY